VFGVSAENIHDHDDGREPRGDAPPGATVLSYHQPNPEVMSDGVDRVTVVQQDDDRYRVDYWGYEMCRLIATRTGVAELGAELLGDRSGVGGWYLADPRDPADGPWWTPDSYDAVPTAACTRCGEERFVAEVFVLRRDAATPLCQDCWDRVQHGEARATGLADDRDTAAELRETAATDPERVDVDRLRACLDRSAPAVRRDALAAVAQLADSRSGDVIDLLPVLAERLRDDDAGVDVRRHAATAIDHVADVHPHHITPIADDVVLALDDVDDRVVTAAARTVAAVADVEPRTVQDAVPKLASLLETDRVPAVTVVSGLAKIAKAHPSSVAPAVDALVAHLDADTATTESQVGALAAVGYVSKDYPDTAATAIPALIGLLDVDADRLRANAAGTLADLADEYPDEVLPATDRVVGLLSDSDEQARYNATSILARLAETAPERVRAAGAVSPLIDVLDDEFEYTRSNACWALGRLKASDAWDELAARRRDDPSEAVRESAAWALSQLDEQE
jgi:HEAT repeat protein